MKNNMTRRRKTCVALALGLLLAALPACPPGAVRLAGPGSALLAAADEKPIRIYTFKEVGDIAQLNGSDIIRQKAAVVQAEQNKESQLTSYQAQVYNYYSDPDSGISENALLSLQDSYESAYNSYVDAEETLEKLKPKAAYQAQKLYIDILQGERQIELQEKEILRLKDEYELAKVKAAFGAFTLAQLNSAKTQWDNALDTLDSLKDSLKTNKNSMREYLNLADAVEFGLENPPVFGQYAAEFDEAEVMAEALKNSLSLKQAQREVDELSEKIRRYESEGESSQADRLAASGPGKDIALKETKQSLIRTVETVMKEYDGLEPALDKAKENLYAAQKTYVTVKMRHSMGIATLNEVRTAEKTVLTAEKDLAQAQYNCYLSAKKVILLKDGILVN